MNSRNGIGKEQSRHVRYLLNILNRQDLLPEQRDVLGRFDRESEKNEGLSDSTRLHQLSFLVQLAVRVKKPWKKMTRADIENHIYSLELSAGSLGLHKLYIRKFFKWLYRSEDYPPVVKWIKHKNSKKRVLPEDILMPVEIRAMVDAADSLRDRALVSVLYESGARPGEIVKTRQYEGLMQKDVMPDQYGVVIMVHGKTGDRRIRLIDSAPDLMLWLNNHPGKGGDKPVFVHLDNPEMPLEDKGVWLLIRKLAKRAGIKKRVYPYLFRHSRATQLAKDFTESELKIMQGWTGDSKMPAVYVHLSGADIDKKRLVKAGLVPEDESGKEDGVLKPRVCPRCRESNPATAKFCYKCGLPLDIETAVKIEKEDAGMMLEMLDLMNRQPRLLEILKKLSEKAQG